MTKKQLIWRLKEQPSVHELEILLDKGVITKDEAREILFRDQEGVEDSEKIKALEDQVKFLEKVVDALSQRKSTTITYTTPYTWGWYGSGMPSYVSHISTGALNGTSGGSTYSVNTAQLLK